MNINIAENLKRLRKRQGLTQEELANFIGVSFQSVSKWERGDGYPDITTLPTIANFFDITLDELLGMNQIKNSKKRNELFQKSRSFASEGKMAETISILREGLVAFPNDFEIMADLACYLDGYGNTSNEKHTNREEAIKLSYRILEFCPDSKICSNVKTNLCFTLFSNGYVEKAIATAKCLPSVYKTEEMTLPRFLSGKEKIEYCQIAVQKLIWCLWFIIHRLEEEPHYTKDKKLNLLNTAKDIYELAYENKDLGYGHIRVGDCYEDMAIIQFKDGDIDNGFNNLEKSVEHYKAYDNIVGDYHFSSILFDTLTFNKGGTSKPNQNNCCRNLLDSIYRDDDGIYKAIMNDNRMKKIIINLKETSN